MFQAVWGGFVILLLATTWPVWWCTGDYPALPLIDMVRRNVGVETQHGVLRTATILVVVSLLVVVMVVVSSKASLRCLSVSRVQRLGWAVVAVGLGVSFLFDQHRLQPWAYQTFLYAILFATANAVVLRRWIIWVAASVYFFSALGKFDYQFVHTVGQDFVQQVLRWLGIAGGLNDGGDQGLLKYSVQFAFLLPVTEMIAALCLLFRKTRKLGGVLVMMMHFSLVVLLGPWGLDHSTGVLVWNVALCVQALLLFVLPNGIQTESVDAGPVDRNPSITWPVARIIMIVALVAPLGERWGYWDHWLSWSLYSPHTSRVTIELHRSSITKLPEQMQCYVWPDHDQDGWQRLDIEGWSLDVRRAPIYPQSRYQLSLAIELGQQYRLGPGIRVIRRSLSDRWTGKRKEDRMIGMKEMHR